MKLAVIIAALCIAGCATPDNASEQFHKTENQYFYHEAGSTRVNVQWIRVSPERLQRVCKLMVAHPVKPGSVFLGCAGLDLAGTCIIYTTTNTTHQILGHELRHCFQGNFHK